MFWFDICPPAIKTLTFAAKFSKHIFPAAGTGSKMSFRPLNIDLALSMFQRGEETECSLEKIRLMNTV